MINYTKFIPRNKKTYIYIFLAIICCFLIVNYGFQLKEGLANPQQQCGVMPNILINNPLYDNTSGHKFTFYESKTPLTGNCYWPSKIVDNVLKEDTNGTYKYCPLICPQVIQHQDPNNNFVDNLAKCTNPSSNCSATILGAFYDNVTAKFNSNSNANSLNNLNLRNEWVIRVRNNISNNINKALTNHCELSYNNCESICKSKYPNTNDYQSHLIPCRNTCEDALNSCQNKAHLPSFNPNEVNSGLSIGQNKTGEFNVNSIFYPGTDTNGKGRLSSNLASTGLAALSLNSGSNQFASKNPFANMYTGKSAFGFGLGNGLETVPGNINPITGKIVSPEDFNSQISLLTSQQELNSPFGVFKGYLKNLVKEVQNESAVGIGRVPNSDNPFLCDYVKSSAFPVSQSYIQDNPANHGFNGFTASIAPFF